MTILEHNNVTPLCGKKKSSLSLSLKHNSKEQQTKRKCVFGEESSTNKRLVVDKMLNGYRSDQRGGNGGEISQDSPVATLSNMGNTCYLNSVLYTLRFAPTFLHNLHHLFSDLTLVSNRLNQTKAKTSSLGRNIGSITGPSSRSTSSKDLLSLGTCNNDVIPKSKVQVVTEKLHNLFVTMHSNEMRDSTDPYQPNALLQAIREANAIFEGNHQQDAHELLVYLLDNIRDTCDMLTQQVQQNPDVLNEAEILPTPNNSKLWNVRRSWKKTHKKKDKANCNKESISEEQVNGACATDTEDAGSVDSGSENSKKKIAYNFVAEDFEGVTLRRTRCLECESVTERKEPFYDIPVPIPIKEGDLDLDFNTGGTMSTLYRKACVTSEKLCDANKYLCEKCVRYNEASRDVTFEKLPNIMVLQLKRFTTSSAGVQKVNTFMPTPLDLECFCETCCKYEEQDDERPHHYRLCCVIMHVGGTMASGHYKAFVKASDHLEDYAECSRNLPKGNLSASSSEKSLNIFKYFKSKPLSAGGAPYDGRSSILSSSKSVLNGVRFCKSVECCGVKVNKNVMENVINSYTRRSNNGTDPSSSWSNGGDQMWLECDDENVKPITSQELEEELSYKPNSPSTPYLLFYSKIKDLTID